MPKKPQNKIAFSDLGLKTEVPACLLKSKTEMAQQKRVEKKERAERIKQATAELAGRKAEVEQLRDYGQQQREKDREKKAENKQKLQREHIHAQVAREKKEQEALAHMQQRQAELTNSNVVVQLANQEDEEETRKAILADQERRIAAAPMAVSIPVLRTPEVEEVRKALPVVAEEQAIVEYVNDSAPDAPAALLVCGQTGSGKTTQVPQFLWEAGYGHEQGAAFGRSGMIVVTEPRRVAAVSMAKRVAHELNETFGDNVCYHVRYSNNVSPNCRLKFVTEGILLREIQDDFLLRKYSAVIVDEAHERSVSCDVLVGLLSRIAPLRRAMSEEESGSSSPEKLTPLRLIIMSATLRVEDFRDSKRLFPRPPPLVNVDARMFPVTSHYARRTEVHRYVDKAFEKVKQIHKKLPPGGILVFLSTQREIESLCSQLRDHYAKTRIHYDTQNYGKHALLASRREAGKRKKPEENRSEEKERDEYGLFTADYALDGDEGAADEAATAFGWRDDFDYGLDMSGARKGAVDDVAEASIGHGMGTATGDVKKKTKREETTQKNDRMKPTGRERGQPDKRSDSYGGDLFGEVGSNEWQSRDEGEENAEQEKEEEAEEEESVDIIAHNDDVEDEEDGAFDTLHVLPLYSLLPMEEQQRVFDLVPEGKRLCVVATNVAETSITIPCVRYVVDTGRVKQKVLQQDTGAQVYQIQWTSQASAEQRAGRAGRTGPGHCYRLYSTGVFTNWMAKHSVPEILRTPLESVVLMMKDMHIEHVAKFPFPTPPSAGAIQSAMQHLVRIGALRASSFLCTELGSRLLAYPVPPRFAKMLHECAALLFAVRQRLASLSAQQSSATATSDESARRVMKAIHIAVAVVSVSVDVFRSEQLEQSQAMTANKEGEGGDGTHADSEGTALRQRVDRIKELKHPGSDFITYVRAFAVFATRPTVHECSRYGLVHKSLTESLQLCRQLERITVNDVMPRLAPADTALYSEKQKKKKAKGVTSADAGCVQPHSSAIEDYDFVNEDVFNDVRRSNGTSRAAEKCNAQRIGNEASNNSEFTLRMDAAMLQKLTRDEELTIRKLIAIGLIDQVARRATPFECRMHGVALKANLQKTSKTPYLHVATKRIVYVHPSSSIAKTYPPPEYVCFALLQVNKRVVSSRNDSGHYAKGSEEPSVYMKGCTVLTKAWLVELGYKEEEEEEV